MMADQPAHGPLQPRYPLRGRLSTGAVVIGLKTFVFGLKWAQSWKSWLYPPDTVPDVIKTYECRPHLPIRIFFPKNYDRSSAKKLPTLFNFHGGGFVFGEPEDDDACNRRFADTYSILVVELNYRKGPWYPFPTGLHDAEALLLAAYDDSSLPIDKNRIAAGGYSAGAVLSLSVVQLPSIRDRVKPSAVIPLYPGANESLSSEERVGTRYFKPSLPPRRNGTVDYLASALPMLRWCYIPYGHNLHDPLISPLYASREHLPRNIFVVAAELDLLAHEAWELASKLAGRPVPSKEDKVGQEQPASDPGQLILDDERFHFQSIDSTGGSIGWLLVPDALHGFDHMTPAQQGMESMEDAHIKTVAYQKILGEWLHNVAWKDAEVNPAGV